MNCEAYSSLEGVSLEHRIVTANIPLTQRKKAAQKTAAIHCDWSLLNDRDIIDKYTLTLRNDFDAVQEISETTSPINEYENFVNVHVEAAGERIPTKQIVKPRVTWETLAVRKRRADVKTASKRNRRNLTNINALEHKAHNELPNICRDLFKNVNN